MSIYLVRKLYEFYNYKIWNNRFASVIPMEDTVKILRNNWFLFEYCIRVTQLSSLFLSCSISDFNWFTQASNSASLIVSVLIDESGVCSFLFFEDLLSFFWNRILVSICGICVAKRIVDIIIEWTKISTWSSLKVLLLRIIC